MLGILVSYPLLMLILWIFASHPSLILMSGISHPILMLILRILIHIECYKGRKTS
jgi:hypothetical protein